jgi:hypothetical protein
MLQFEWAVLHIFTVVLTNHWSERFLALTKNTSKGPHYVHLQFQWSCGRTVETVQGDPATAKAIEWWAAAKVADGANDPTATRQARKEKGLTSLLVRQGPILQQTRWFQGHSLCTAVHSSKRSQSYRGHIMPITGFNELVEELKLMREQFKEQQERQVAEQRKRQQLETCIEELQRQLSTEQRKRQQLETYVEELLNKPGKLPFLNELPTNAKFFEEVFQVQNEWPLFQSANIAGSVAALIEWMIWTSTQLRFCTEKRTELPTRFGGTSWALNQLRIIWKISIAPNIAETESQMDLLARREALWHQ